MSKRTLEELSPEQAQELLELELDSQEELFSLEEELSPPASPDIFVEDAVTAYNKRIEKEQIDYLLAELVHVQGYIDKFEERKDMTLLSLLNCTPVLL